MTVELITEVAVVPISMATEIAVVMIRIVANSSLYFSSPRY